MLRSCAAATRNNAGRERCSELLYVLENEATPCQRAGYEALFAGAWGGVGKRGGDWLWAGAGPFGGRAAQTAGQPVGHGVARPTLTGFCSSSIPLYGLFLTPCWALIAQLIPPEYIRPPSPITPTFLKSCCLWSTYHTVGRWPCTQYRKPKCQLLVLRWSSG